ncbi:MAG: class I SAM-dependent methyltransferase [Candidatus Hodarchaeales archaeon]
MIRKFLAYKELTKLGRAGKAYKEVNHFFKAIVLEVLIEDLELLSYLSTPKSLEKIFQNYEVKDQAYLKLILDTLVNDRLIIRNNGTYQTLNKPRITIIKPHLFNDSIVDVLKAYASNIANRLHGQCLEFSEGITLFNWDDALSTKMYETIRRASFLYANPFKKPGKIADIGCGNGWGTAAIWLYHHKRGLIYPRTKVRIYGIEPDKSLLQIAKEEFPTMLRRHQRELNNDIIENMERYGPIFVEGSVNSIPFEDEYFDYVFLSQVLHWTDPVSAIQECYRVLKPGGLFFGTEVFIPEANPYIDILTRVVENAHGFFRKEDMIQWAKEAGFREFNFTSPVTLFKLKK